MTGDHSSDDEGFTDELEMVDTRSVDLGLLLKERAESERSKSSSFLQSVVTELDDLEYLDRMLEDLPLKWNHLMPSTIAEIFCNVPLHLLDEAWKRLDRGNPLYLCYCNLDCSLALWKPSLLENEEKRLYESFCPVIMCMKTDTFRFIGYKSAKISKHLEDKKWYVMPSLAYLPTDIKKVIAGDGGLLVCDGGRQPRRPPIKGEHIFPLTHDLEDDWDREIYPEGQSVLLVTNPLTREYMFLPPMQGKILTQKCGCIMFEPKILSSKSSSKMLNKNVKRMSSTSIPVGFEPFSHDPNEYYPPGINPEMYTKGKSFRGSRIWQHNGTKESSNDTQSLKPDITNFLKKQSQRYNIDRPVKPQPTIHGSEGDEPGTQARLENMAALMFETNHMHDRPDHVKIEFDSSVNAQVKQVDKYKENMFELCHHYVVVVMGYNLIPATLQNKKVEEILCAVYKSSHKSKGWFIRPTPLKARLMPTQQGHTGLALIKIGNWMAVCFGGLLVEEITKETIEENSSKSSSGNGSQSSTPREEDESKIEKIDVLGVDAYDSLYKRAKYCPAGVHKQEIFEPKFVTIEKLSPALFWVPMVPEDDSALAFSFSPMNTIDGFLQSPIVIQPFGSQTTMPTLYAVTRKAVKADTISIFAIGIDCATSTNPAPTGHYIPVTHMPTNMFNDIFETIDYSQKEFECSGGNGLICIRVKDFKLMAFYDVLQKVWFTQDYAKYLPTKARSRPYQMFENTIWEPNFWQKVETEEDPYTEEDPLSEFGAPGTNYC